MTLGHVAIVGAGLSGALQALHLLEAGVPKVSLIERERVPGRGVAYGTDRPEHLLNVTAGRMSAFPDRPDHFARWAAPRGFAPDDYVPRRLYGDYVCGLLGEAGAGLEIVEDETVAVLHGSRGEELHLRSGAVTEADAVVLALGNLRPALPPGIDPDVLGPIWVADPWSTGFAADLADGDQVLLIGTGLTAVDAALTLEAAGFPGRILAVSRRGLSPRFHVPLGARSAGDDLPPGRTVPLLRHVRARGDEIGWRNAVDALRPLTQTLWDQAAPAERLRFLRHLRPWWDVHRHRIAPEVGSRIGAMEAAGRLRFAAGRIVAAAPAEGGNGSEEALVRWRPRGSDQEDVFRAARIVNCTGPEVDVTRADEPLLKALLANGRIEPDPLRLGIHVDRSCRVVEPGGATSDTLFAIGPLTRGAFWESVAVPDIAVQAQQLARQLAAAP